MVGGSTLRLTLVTLLWLTFGLLSLRLTRLEPGQMRIRLRLWQLYLIGCLVFSVTGEAAEQQVDAVFGGIPVSLYIKYFGMVEMSARYYQIVGPAAPRPVSIQCLLRGLYPLALLAGITSLGVLLLSGTWANPQIRYFVAAARDVVIATYMLLAFLPLNRVFRQQEQVPTMRLKHIFGRLLILTYLAVTASSLISLMVVVFAWGEVSRLLPLFLPLTYLCAVWFGLMLLPHRWTAALLLPERWWTWRRLRRVERQLARLTNTPSDISELEHPVEIELAIYRTIIAILDEATLLEAETVASPLTRQLTTLLQSPHPYATLVKEMAALPHHGPNP